MAVSILVWQVGEPEDLEVFSKVPKLASKEIRLSTLGARPVDSRSSQSFHLLALPSAEACTCVGDGGVTKNCGPAKFIC